MAIFGLLECFLTTSSSSPKIGKCIQSKAYKIYPSISGKEYLRHEFLSWKTVQYSLSSGSVIHKDEHLEDILFISLTFLPAFIFHLNLAALTSVSHPVFSCLQLAPKKNFEYYIHPPLTHDWWNLNVLAAAKDLFCLKERDYYQWNISLMVEYKEFVPNAGNIEGRIILSALWNHDIEQNFCLLCV